MSTCVNSNTKRAYPDWLPTLAQSQGFQLDALDANRAGRYSAEQVQLLERRGRSIMEREAPSAYGALAIGVLLTLFLFLAGGIASTGVLREPGAGAMLLMALLVPLFMLFAGGLALRSIRRSWQNLRTDLMQHPVACVEGPLILQGPPPAEACLNFNPVAGKAGRAVQILSIGAGALLYEMNRPRMQQHDSTWGKYFYIVDGVAFEVNPQAWFGLAQCAGCRFRVYYVPSYKWIVNMEPME